MTLRAITLKQPPTRDPEVPRLEPGDHLTRDEFERRYEVTPGIKAELIEGVVFFVSPVARSGHFGSPRADLITWLGRYRAFTHGVRVGCDSSVRLDLKNEIQPDAAMVIERAYRGQTRVSEDGFLEGAPELVGEVSASSVSIDMNSKLKMYCHNGVRECLVWRVKHQRIDWFALKQGQYEPLPEVDGIIRSEVFPGLWLKPEALINDDPTTALRVLQQGVDSPEHAAFVSQLKSRAASQSAP